MKSSLGALPWLGSLVLSLPVAAAQERSTDELLVKLQEEYGAKSKKYDALAKKVRKEVERALGETTWVDATGAETTLESHPYLALVEGLGETGAELGKKKSRVAKKMLERFPWPSDLELVTGLEFGSDRAVPDHDNGFIHLGRFDGPTPGFPDLELNTYLYGLDEVVGWQYGVEAKRSLAFSGREARDGPEGLDELPGWESLRVLLEGYLPEVPLLAIPALTHRIHQRLVERRAGDPEEARVDEVLAFLDSRWNGFTFETEFAEDPIPIALPAHFLYAHPRGFVQSFETGRRLASTGDVPFISDPATLQYAREFLDSGITMSDLISETPSGREAYAGMNAALTWAARYKTLVEVLVHAVLVPTLRFPGSLSTYDYREGRVPTERAISGGLDTTRLHALLVWAACGADPEAVADFLYDEILAPEANRFPADVALPIELTTRVRSKRDELLARLRERIEAEPEGAFARELSPFATWLDAATPAAMEYVAHSHAAYHAPLAQAIRAAARSVVEAELE